MHDTALALGHWLRLLWGRLPAVHLGSAQPFIADGALHLPAHPGWLEHRAAAAHATAHLVYSPRRFDGTGLQPVVRVLLALLEDARVEQLAQRELPGLARLWRPLHTASAADGAGFEALMLRLSRALVDPSYADPHPWVHKGRGLFYLDPGAQELLALRTPAELLLAARRLGHDIGQMRLGFNARSHRPGPGYRDDHRWMWAADTPPQPAAGRHAGHEGAEAPAGAIARDAGDETPPEGSLVTTQAEWDRLIGRLRPGWCTVVESREPQAPAAGHTRPLPALRPAGPDLRPALAAWLTSPARGGRQDHGDAFDLDALVDWQLAARSRRAGHARVHRGLRRRPVSSAVWVLVDQSVSSAERATAAGPTRLHIAARAAAAVAAALQSMGVACAVSGFNSCGRHAVRLRTVKGFETPADGGLPAALQALHSGGSTRLGAVLRHASRGLAARRAGARGLLVLSDLELHDIDVHDPRYLPADLQLALQEAARRGVRVACLALAAPGAGALRAGLAGRCTPALDRLEALPRALRRAVG